MMAITWQDFEKEINSIIETARDELETAKDMADVIRAQTRIELAREMLERFKKTT